MKRFLICCLLCTLCIASLCACTQPDDLEGTSLSSAGSTASTTISKAEDPAPPSEESIMSDAAPKEVVESFLRKLQESDTDGLQLYFADDMGWNKAELDFTLLSGNGYSVFEIDTDEMLQRDEQKYLSWNSDCVAVVGANLYVYRTKYAQEPQTY